MKEETLFLTEREMEIYGGPYMEYCRYFTPWAQDEIVAYVANFIKLFSGRVTTSVARKMQKEFPSAIVTVEEGKIKFLFPLTVTIFYVAESTEATK